MRKNGTFRARCDMRRVAFAGAILFAFALAAGGATTLDEHFTADAHGAMNTMMAAMDVAPSGNVDTDFVAMMIPHHQGAIDMAAAEVRYGQNEQLRRIAQEIVVTQNDEIVAMRRAQPGAGK